MRPETVTYLARCALHARGLHPVTEPVTLGAITLLPHQAAAVRWLQHRIGRYGGALLADPPGLGKTYVALAVAARRNERPLVIAPAALRARWRQAADATSVTIDFVSTERLSAPAPPRLTTPDFVIVDEAHHLRSTDTRRHRRTARLCEQARVLLLTATPIHNRAEDLEGITSLFHMPPTRENSSALRTLTLRRTLGQIHAAGLGSTSAFRIPAVTNRRSTVLPPRDCAITSAISRLPPISDTDREGHALLQVSLLHALRSSDAACTARVRHRIAVTLAIEHAAQAQVAATPALRKAWRAGGDAIQLAMPQLLAPPTTVGDPETATRAANQRTALERMLPLLHGHGDARRAVALRRLARWCSRPVVAFTQFRATAESMFGRLSVQPGVALLSGTEARIASGTVPRAEVLQRLLSPDRRSHTAVRLLITTDVLSEGLSLSGVGTIVHLDLPWTAARIDQRIGRAARIGAPVGTVKVVSLPASTPPGADARLRALLRRKRRTMHDFEREQGEDLERWTLLADLASTHERAAGQPRPGWVTVRSSAMDGQPIRVVAVVRLLGRRQIVAHDDGWLRAPSAADWRAMTHVVCWQSGVAREVRQRLRAMLQEHVDEAQLRVMLSRSDDERLNARRAVDATLLAAGSQQRLALAPRISETRRALSQVTRSAKVRTLVASMQALATKQELWELTEQAVGPFDERVAVYTGVVILPA